MKTLFTVIFVALIVNSCVDVPEGIKPVKRFKINRYLGTWYEIARLDNVDEQGLKSVSAEYRRNQEGDVVFKNRGYLTKWTEWREKEGRLSLAGDPNLGHLKVSYFWPFYKTYVIFELDPDYEYAYVCGKDRSLLWLLSRSKFVKDDIIDDFIEKSQKLGFDTSKLILVDQF